MGNQFKAMQPSYAINVEHDAMCIAYAQAKNCSKRFIADRVATM